MLPQRFWDKVEKTATCWNWTAYIAPNGYGHFQVAKNNKALAHRLSFFDSSNAHPIAGHHVDHICRNRRCVNPAHLRQITARENILSNSGPSAKNALKTHCMRGHALTEGNIYLRNDGKQRECKMCNRAAGLAWDRANRPNRIGRKK